MDRTAQMTVAYARTRSSGKTKAAELRRLGHPFAKRHGAALLDTSTINEQKGLFKSSWMVKTAPIASYTRVVHNVASYADYLQDGTRFAFARPLQAKLREYADTTLNTQLQIGFGRIEESHRA